MWANPRCPRLNMEKLQLALPLPRENCEHLRWSHRPLLQQLHRPRRCKEHVCIISLGMHVATELLHMAALMLSTFSDPGPLICGHQLLQHPQSALVLSA
jgi:hypothetical protein